MGRKKKVIKKNHFNIIIPVASFLVIFGFLFYGSNGLTGSTVYDPDSRFIDADVTFKTTSAELIPEGSIIRVSLDDRNGEMSVKDFISLSGGEFEYVESSLEKIGYSGMGYTGDHNYKINVTNFDIDTIINVGEHQFVTEIIFDDVILYRKEKIIIID